VQCELSQAIHQPSDRRAATARHARHAEANADRAATRRAILNSWASWWACSGVLHSPHRPGETQPTRPAIRRALLVGVAGAILHIAAAAILLQIAAGKDHRFGPRASHCENTSGHSMYLYEPRVKEFPQEITRRACETGVRALL
jgi:hypothetical protein